MKILIIFSACLIITNCSPLDKVKTLLESLDDDMDELKKETKALIEETLQETQLLKKVADDNIEQSEKIIQADVDKILKYSLTRTSRLIQNLTDELQTLAHNYPKDANEDCLTTINFIKSLPMNFADRLKITLETAVRNANKTIRVDEVTMKTKLGLLNNLTTSLNACGNEQACIVEIADLAVTYNTDYIKSFNDILQHISGIPRQAKETCIYSAKNTVLVDEDYACNNADSVKFCFASFDDEVSPTTTSTALPVTSPRATTGTTYRTTAMATPLLTLEAIKSQQILTGLLSSSVYCDNRAPFQPYFSL